MHTNAWCTWIHSNNTGTKIQTVGRTFIEASYLAVEDNSFQCFLGNRAVLTFDLYLGQINYFHITNPVWKVVNGYCLVLLTAHVQTLKPDITCSIWLSASAKALHHYMSQARERCDADWLRDIVEGTKKKHFKSIKGSGLFCGHSTPYIRHLSICLPSHVCVMWMHPTGRMSRSKRRKEDFKLEQILPSLSHTSKQAYTHTWSNNVQKLDLMPV